MKLYLVTRTDNVQYDEYDGFVIRAASRERAVEIAQEKEPHAHGWDVLPMRHTGAEGVIIGSFIAG